MNSPAAICGGILVSLVTALLLLTLMPIGIFGLLCFRTIEAIADGRAWAAFARFWWGRPAHG